MLSILGGLTVGCSKKDAASEAPAETTAPAPVAAPAPAPEPTPEPTPAPEPPTAEPAAAGDVDLSNWDQYWPEFKKAALAKDADALRALTLMGDDNEQISDSALDDIVKIT